MSTSVPGAPTVAPKPRRNPWRTAWRVIYWGSIVAGAWGIFLMLRRAPAPQVTTSPGAALSAQQKLSELGAPRTPSLSPGEPQRIVLTEEELNSLLAERLQAANAQELPQQGIGSVRDMKVKLTGDRARIFGLFTVAGKDLTLELEGRVRVVDGYVRFEATGGSLGDLALPKSALESVIARMFDNAETRESFRMPSTIRDIRVENGELMIERQ